VWTPTKFALDPPDERFLPDVHLAEMLTVGVHGGWGYSFIYDEGLPALWLDNARFSTLGCADSSLNMFGLLSGKSGYKDVFVVDGNSPDHYGWLQWYARYLMGRRNVGLDDPQIARWASLKARLQGIVLSSAGGDIRASWKERQALLENACDPFFDVRKS
jgi:hypothetical protein